MLSCRVHGGEVFVLLAKGSCSHIDLIYAFIVTLSWYCAILGREEVTRSSFLAAAAWICYALVLNLQGHVHVVEQFCAEIRPSRETWLRIASWPGRIAKDCL